MLEIAICDDSVIVSSDIESKLQRLAKKFAIDIEIDIFYDGNALVKHICNGNRYDLIYLDIEMQGKNGVDAAREIRVFDKKALIIYVTNYESFAKEAFEVSAFRFITKPINVNKFEKYFIDAKEEIIKNPRYFRYQHNKIPYRVPIDEIMYFQSDKRITYIITNHDSRKCYGKINDIEKKLLEVNILFYRVHQSFLVNPKYVAEYYYNTMVLIDGTTITVSENRRKKVNKLFCTIKGEDIIV